MKRASYKHAVEWIAINDESASLDLEEIRWLPTTLLVEEIFCVDGDRIARDVLRLRERDRKNRTAA